MMQPSNMGLPSTSFSFVNDFFIGELDIVLLAPCLLVPRPAGLALILVFACRTASSSMHVHQRCVLACSA